MKKSMLTAFIICIAILIVGVIYLSNPFKQITCNDIDRNPSELTFELSYCQGDMCHDAQNKTDCESRDMIKVENGKIVSGQDGKPDCIWSENSCKPNI